MDTDVAVPISNSVIFFNALTRFIMNYKQTHPTKDFKSSIDYDLVIIMMPLSMLGAMFGVMLHDILPQIAVVIGLTGILVFMSYMTIKKAVELWRKESQAKNPTEMQM